MPQQNESNAPLIEAEQNHPYAKGKAVNLGSTPLAAAGQSVGDVVTAGYSTITVLSRIGNGTTPATASGDIAGGLLMFEDDGTTLSPSTLSATQLRIATLSGSVAWQVNQYPLGGIDKVRIVVQNNNAGALQGATAVYFLQK